MTQEDKDLLRDMAAFFAMQGYLANGDYLAHEIPRLSYEMADAMVQEREHTPISAGLPSITKRRRK